MSHYFIEDKSKEDIREITYHFKGEIFNFLSDFGLFSKDHVDYASDLLMQHIGRVEGSVLDLGCGYGPIGIVLAKCYGAKVTMTDVNPKAIRFARENAVHNGIEAVIFESDGFSEFGADRVFDYIILNPPIHAGKQLMFGLYEGAFEHLKSGGHFYIVIQKRHGAESSQKKLETLFGNCRVLYKKKGVFVFDAMRV